MKKKEILIGLCFLFSIFLFVNISAISTCCEKTTSGAYCQQITSSALCSVGARNVPTSCEATSYCKTGTCIDDKEGICLSSPRVTCENNGGHWDERASKDIPQCQPGCCVLQEQTAFVPQTRCERFSSMYGLETNFLANVQTEAECVALANPSEKGACVFENDKAQNTCELTTKKECQDKKTANPTAKFHSGYLCSAESLETICGPRGGTRCVEGKDGVYFKDTCGNPGNIYDYSKLNDDNYWTFIQDPDPATCSIINAKDSASCGNCDYNLGSICKQTRTGESVSYGDNICRNLDCVGYSGQGFTGTNGNYPKHQEAWCAQSNGAKGGIIATSGNITGTGNNAPGSQYFQLMCYNGEVIPTNCDNGVADGARAKICIESNLGTEANPFRNAICRDNLWQSCASINNSKDCNNNQVVDCKWLGNGYFFTSEGLGNKTERDELKTNTAVPSGTCIPLYAPGFVRNVESTSQNGADTCKVSTANCVVQYDFSLLDLVLGLKDKLKAGTLTLAEKKKLCKKNCQCLEYGVEENWYSTVNGICSSLGDCGMKKNVLGISGEPVDVIDIKAAEEGQ